MIIDINEQTVNEIKNPAFASYAHIYVRIYEQFMDQFKGTGVEIDPACYEQQLTEKMARLRQKGAIFRNQDKSIYVNQISPACVACQTGVGSATFFVSLKCHRDCYYCFNPNQENYDYFNQHKRNVIGELARAQAAGQKIKHLALTGGEPLLHKQEAVEFYQFASDKFPDAFTRLYTCGDYADETILAELQAAGLDEIRFSIRMHDLAKGHRFVFERIALAKQYIPHVLVEMPILPGTLEIMKDVLLELDQLGVDSINLLEFCFPLVNAPAFRERAFKLKAQPYKILYNYWYAGGLPIAHSELECLDLLEFALDQELTMGVHYCSLENKHTGQIYQQNFGQTIPPTHYFSEKDYFLKSAKVYGADIPKVLKLFRRQRITGYVHNDEYDYLEFHVDQIGKLGRLNVEVGVSSSVMEMRDDGQYLRELKVDLTRPSTFDRNRDI
ncbi:MAG: radical SAM protein [Chloroflexota bacterium]|jgi:uncharacterized protein